MTAHKPPHFITTAEMQIEQAPWCQCDWLCRPGLTPTENLLLVRAHMPPGEAHRFHCHPHAEELIYVLEGQAEQWVGEEKRLLGAGDLAQIPMGVVHATRNVGDAVLRFLAILTPAKFEGPAVVDMYEQEPWRSIEAAAGGFRRATSSL